MTAVDDALDRIEMALPDYPEDLATVRDHIRAIQADRDGAVDEVLRLREKLEEWEEAEGSSPSWEQVDKANDRYVAAEAEVRQLREAQSSLLAEKVRLTEGLREVCATDWDVNEGITPFQFEQRIHGIASRALLADSPPDGGGAKRPPPPPPIDIDPATEFGKP